MRTLWFIMLAIVPLSMTAQRASTPPWLVNATAGISIRLAGSNASTTAASTYTAGPAFRPGDNTLMFAMVVNSKASAPDIPTGSGHGLTWTQIRTTNYNTLASPTCRLTIFYARTRSSNTTNAFVADFAGVNQTGCIVQVVEVAQVYTSGTQGTNGVLQIVHGGNNANTNAVATYGTLTGTRDLTIGWVGGSLNSANNAAESGWTKLADQNYNNPATEGTTVYKLQANDTSFLVTNAASMSWAVVATELLQR